MAVRFDEARKRWLVEFEQAGIRVFQRLPQGCTKSQGEARQAQLRREIYDRETLRKVPPLTLESAINQWLTEDHRRKDRNKMQSEAKQWIPHSKGKLLRDVPEVAQAAIASWIQPSCAAACKSSAPTTHVSPTPTSRGAQSARGSNGVTGHAPATINRRLAMLKAVCRHAYKQGRIAENLSGRITVLPGEGKREVYLTREQVMRLATCASSTASTSAIIIAAYTGLRAGELLALSRVTTTHADTLTVATSKNGKPRIVPVPRPALPYLSALPLGISYWQLHDQFLEARKKAKLKGVRFHDLRHTCASWLINAGVDLYTVGKILGHSSTQTTQRYAHLSHATLKDAMGRLK